VRTELEITQAMDMLLCAKDGAKRLGLTDEAFKISMFVDLLKWIKGEPSHFGPQLEVIRKVVESEIN